MLLGLGSLTAHDHPAAAEAFARAPGDANVYHRAYALALGGRRAEVVALAAEARARPAPRRDDTFWA